VTELSEGLLAVVTGVRFNSCVDSYMLSKVACVGEGFRAMRTLMRFGFCVVSVKERQT